MSDFGEGSAYECMLMSQSTLASDWDDDVWEWDGTGECPPYIAPKSITTVEIHVVSTHRGGVHGPDAAELDYL